MDMYKHKDYPYLKFNYDGIIGKPGMYIPNEIKVVTKLGEKHYNPMKAFFSEKSGLRPLPTDVSDNNGPAVEKAAHYGIPAYYYTQLQQEIFGAGSDYGYLTILLDSSWELFTFFVYRDEKVISAIITEGYKVWNKVLMLNPARAYE